LFVRDTVRRQPTLLFRHGYVFDRETTPTLIPSHGCHIFTKNITNALSKVDRTSSVIRGGVNTSMFVRVEFFWDACQTCTQYLHLLAARDPAQLRYGNNGQMMNQQFSSMRRQRRQRRDHVGERGSQAARNFTAFCISPMRTSSRTGGHICRPVSAGKAGT
jgi:hypothetical protein